MPVCSMPSILERIIRINNNSHAKHNYEIYFQQEHDGAFLFH
jgi:hypothetical protein